MFEKNDKKKLYWLMDKYLSGSITAKVFCDEFYYSYDLEIDDDGLNANEKIAFSDLSTVSGRFSGFKEDHEKYPGTYFTEDQLRQKIIETKEKLERM